MSDDDLQGWALPAFKPEESLQTLRRGLRDLKLQEQVGGPPWQYRFKGETVAELVPTDQALQVRLVKRPSRSPDWQGRTLRSGAEVRDWLGSVKLALAGWEDE